MRRETCLAGFRWWSAFFGEWHTLVLFSDRLSLPALRFGRPEPLTLRSEALIAAATALGIEIAGG